MALGKNTKGKVYVEEKKGPWGILHAGLSKRKKRHVGRDP